VSRPPIVDSHVHLWRAARLRPGAVLAHPKLAGDVSFADLAAASAATPVEAVVAVAVGPDQADLVAAAEAGAPVAAVTAEARLGAPGLRPRLERLARTRLVRAVRRVTEHEPDQRLCAGEPFVRAVAAAAEAGLACELCVRPGQLDAVVRLADACPRATLVLDHLGKPDLGDRPQAAWLRDIGRLAGRPNVACKVSVVVRSAADPPLRAAAVAPFVTHALERFGFERVLFGSNWPVASVVTAYGDWVELLDAVLAGSSAAELASFWAGTARRVYGLEPSSSQSTRPRTATPWRPVSSARNSSGS
jgi:L-fuconolactonase